MDIFEINRAAKQAQALKRAGRADEAIQMLESLLVTCQSDGTLPGGLAVLHKSVAKSYYARREFERAGQHYLEAIRLYGEQGVDEQQAICVYHFGCCTETFYKSPHFKYYFNGVSHGKAAPFPSDVELWIFELAQREYQKYCDTGMVDYPAPAAMQSNSSDGFFDRLVNLFK